MEADTSGGAAIFTQQDIVPPRVIGPLITIGESLALLVSGAGSRLAQRSTLELRVGGAESNVAIAVARLGTPATWVGRVGDDGFGELVVSTIRGQGVTVRAVLDRVPTSAMVKERRPPGVTRVTYYRDGGPGSRLCPADLPEAEIAAAGVLHLTGITAALGPSALATLHAAIDIAAGAGVPVSFDVNHRMALWTADRARPVLRDLARRCQTLLLGEDEAELLLARLLTLEAAAVELAALGPAEVVIKCGARGAHGFDGISHRTVAALPVVAVDPVGAGDAFVAGYLVERLAGRPVEAALDTAARCGGFAVTGAGDWENSPTRADLALLDMDAGTVQR